MNVPDLAGFREAQERLVSTMGTDVTFQFGSSNTYSSAAYIDAQTGRPLDPTISPVVSSASAAPITERATVIRNPPQGVKNHGISTDSGYVPNGHLWLRLPDGTYDPTILTASTVTVNDEDFVIRRFVRDGIGGIDRLYVECSLLHDDLT